MPPRPLLPMCSYRSIDQRKSHSRQTTTGQVAATTSAQKTSASFQRAGSDQPRKLVEPRMAPRSAAIQAAWLVKKSRPMIARKMAGAR